MIYCGACTIDIMAVSVSLHQRPRCRPRAPRITTIEGVANADGLSASQKASATRAGCVPGTPGMHFGACRCEEIVQRSRNRMASRQHLVAAPGHQIVRAIQYAAANRWCLSGGLLNERHDSDGCKMPAEGARGMGPARRKPVEDIRSTQGKGNRPSTTSNYRTAAPRFRPLAACACAPEDRRHRGAEAAGVPAVITAEDAEAPTSAGCRCSP